MWVGVHLGMARLVQLDPFGGKVVLSLRFSRTHLIDGSHDRILSSVTVPAFECLLVKRPKSLFGTLPVSRSRSPRFCNNHWHQYEHQNTYYLLLFFCPTRNTSTLTASAWDGFPSVLPTFNLASPPTASGARFENYNHHIPLSPLANLPTQRWRVLYLASFNCGPSENWLPPQIQPLRIYPHFQSVQIRAMEDARANVFAHPTAIARQPVSEYDVGSSLA